MKRVARSEVEKGRRKTLSGSLSGYKTHPLSTVESNDNLVVGHLQLIKPNGQNEFSADEKATDEAGNAWRYITAGSANNVKIKGWLKTTQDNVKWVSPWQWPGFTQIDEQTTLAEQRLIQIQAQEQETVPETTQASTEIQTTTSKMAEAYQGSALLTHVLAIIQNLSVDGQAQALNDEQLKATLRYPWLAQRFGHTQVKYESEWYSEIDSEGKMAKWEALNEQMSSEVQSYLDFLNDQQDKKAALAKLEQNHRQLFNDTKTAEYLQKMNEFFDGLSSLKRHAQNDAKKRESLNSFKTHLANNIELWEKEKQRIKTLLWWDEVAKKLATKQTAQTKESEAAKADQQPLPSLSVDGKAWYLHPVAFVGILQNNISSTFDKKYTAKDNEVYINIITPKTRDLEGPLVVFDSSGILFKTHSLCRGSNSNRTKASGNGDTPTGRATTYYAPKAHKGDFSFGNHGLIYLIGESGEFLTATKNGRAGIAIHCGHTTGYYKKSLEDLNELMGTHGCVRIYNNAMKELGELYTKLKNDGKTIYCYIEDYDGDIKKVYAHYGFAEDPKDKTRGKRSEKQ